MIKRIELTQTNRPCDVINFWHREGNLCLDAPYQRGDVWGDRRRANLIRSILLGVPIPSIIINDRLGACWPDEDFRIVVIDGKQRITSLLKFVGGELAVPGDWFGIPKERIVFEDLGTIGKRKFLNIPMAFSEGKLPSIEMEMEVFDLVNFGGVPQGEKDEG